MPCGATDDAGGQLANFFSAPYQAHNRARLAHLESLGLPLANRRVLELGSGPGDHTGFYVKRGCAVVSVDSRQECLGVLQQRYPDVETVVCDLNDPTGLRPLGTFDVIHCYGILYHLEQPAQLIRYIGAASSDLVILETCVRAGKVAEARADLVDEPLDDFTQSSTGRGCRPAREWVFEELGRYFPFVYHTRTQPDHPEFPVDWKDLANAPPLIRSVFVASKQPLDLPSLSPKLLDVQQRLDPGLYIGLLESMLAEQRTTLGEREQVIRQLDQDLNEQLYHAVRNFEVAASAAAERLAVINQLSKNVRTFEEEKLLDYLKRRIARMRTRT